MPIERNILVYTRGLERRQAFLNRMRQEGYDIKQVSSKRDVLDEFKKKAVHVLILKHEAERLDEYRSMLQSIADQYPSCCAILVLTEGEPSTQYEHGTVSYEAAKLLRYRNQGRSHPLAYGCFFDHRDLDSELCEITKGVLEHNIRVKHELDIGYDLENSHQFCERMLVEIQGQLGLDLTPVMEANAQRLSSFFASPGPEAVLARVIHDGAASGAASSTTPVLRLEGSLGAESPSRALDVTLTPLCFAPGTEPHRRSEIRLERDDEKSMFERYCRRLSGSWRPTTDGTSSLCPSPSLTLHEFENVLGRVFFGENDVTGVKVSTLRHFPSSGSSDTLTLRLTPVVNRSYETKPVILKFGPAAKIDTEAKNFDRYVHWYTSLGNSVHRLSYASWNHVAGIVYNFLAGRRAATRTRHDVGAFSAFVREQPSSKSCDIISRMFGDQRPAGWYEHIVPGQGWPDNIHEYYRLKWLKNRDRAYFHDKLLSDRLADLPKSPNHVAPISVTESRGKLVLDAIGEGDSFAIRNPCDFITSSHPERETNYCICHGDLHADNLLIDSAPEPPDWYLIDYFYTGPGDLFKDFAELELSVLYSLFLSSKASARHPIRSLRRITEVIATHDFLGDNSAPSDLTLWSPAQEHGETVEQKCKRIIRTIRELAREHALRFYSRKHRGTSTFEESHPAEAIAEDYYWGLYYAAMKRLLYKYSLRAVIGYFVIAGAAAAKLDAALANSARDQWKASK